MEQIEYVALKRQTTFEYLKRCHQTHGKSDVRWMNLVKMSSLSLEAQTLHRLTEQLFLLGYSFSRLLDLHGGAGMVNACAQLLEEYLHFVHHSMKHRFPAESRSVIIAAHDKDQPIKPQIRKHNRQVVYEFIQTPHIAGPLTYCQVVYSLCEVFGMLYNKFVDPECAEPLVLEALLKFDAKLQQSVLSRLITHISQVASAKIDEEVRGVLEYVNTPTPND